MDSLARSILTTEDETKALLGSLFEQRGDVHYKQMKLDAAMDDLRAAATYARDTTRIRTLQAMVTSLKGDFAAALSICDELIARQPLGAGPYRLRSRIRDEAGDVAGAFSDIDYAIELEPDSYLSRRHRAILLMAERRWAEALDEWDRCLALAKSEQPYFYFFRHIAWRHVRPDEPDAQLARIAPGIKEPWARQISQFLLGEITAETLIAGTEGERESVNRERRCEGCYYAGAVLPDVHRDRSLDYFRQSVATQQRTFVEYVLAQRELARG